MEAIINNDFTDQKIKEAEVIERILVGEKELYEILVRRNNQMLFRVVRSYLKDTAEIEDIMQNTYLKAFIKLYQFKLESSFSTWLIRIGINESLARLKEKEKLYHLNDHLDISKSNSVLEIPDNKQLNPHDKMIQIEAKQLLENAIDGLSIKYKSVYIMKQVEEMSTEEVAIALEISVANVKVRLHRSKEMLKEKLFEVTQDKNIFEFGFSSCDKITENVMGLI